MFNLYVSGHLCTDLCYDRIPRSGCSTPHTKYSPCHTWKPAHESCPRISPWTNKSFMFAIRLLAVVVVGHVDWVVTLGQRRQLLLRGSIHVPYLFGDISVSTDAWAGLSVYRNYGVWCRRWSVGRRGCRGYLIDANGLTVRYTGHIPDAHISRLKHIRGFIGYRFLLEGLPPCYHHVHQIRVDASYVVQYFLHTFSR